MSGKRELLLGERFLVNVDISGVRPDSKGSLLLHLPSKWKSPSVKKFYVKEFPSIFEELDRFLRSNRIFTFPSQITGRMGYGTVGQCYEKGVFLMLDALRRAHSEKRELEDIRDEVLTEEFKELERKEEEIDKWIEFFSGYFKVRAEELKEVRALREDFIRALKEEIERAYRKPPLLGIGMGGVVHILSISLLGIRSSLEKTVRRMVPPPRFFFDYEEELLKRTPVEKFAGGGQVFFPPEWKRIGVPIKDFKTGIYLFSFLDILIVGEDRIRIIELKAPYSGRRDTVRKSIELGVMQALFYSWLHSVFHRKPAHSSVFIPTAEYPEFSLPQFDPQSSEKLLYKLLNILFSPEKGRPQGRLQPQEKHTQGKNLF